MPGSIETTLRELDSWFNELPGGTERPKLLSRLATLELCGWLEERFDDIVRKAAVALSVDSSSRVEEALKSTSGFEYGSHFRRMLVSVGGEVLVSRTEVSFEVAHAGDLDRLRTSLASLWKTRCELAHRNSAAALTQQVTLNAPSWAGNQQRVIAKLIDKYEAVLTTQLTRLARP